MKHKKQLRKGNSSDSVTKSKNSSTSSVSSSGNFGIDPEGKSEKGKKN